MHNLQSIRSHTLIFRQLKYKFFDLISFEQIFAPAVRSIIRLVLMTNKGQFVLYGWKLSYFTGKLSSYLKYKEIPFVEKANNVFDLFYTVKKQTGAVVMPVLKSPDGIMMQDTRDIMNTLEKSFPHPSVFPTSPRKRLVSDLLEVWGDEWWVPVAMHYRWNYPASVDFFMKEAGDALLPFAPRIIKNIPARISAKVLRSFLPIVGVRPEQHKLLERWTEKTLTLLETHFAEQPFLLGNTPSIGDFSLMGPIYAHLSRDPWPRDNLMNRFPHVMSWVDRMQKPHSTLSLKKDEDTIPDTLLPVLKCILQEFTPMATGTLSLLVKHLESDPSIADKTLRRVIPGGDVTFPIDGSEFKRRANPFTLWKIQILVDHYRSLSNEEQVRIMDWIEPLGGKELLLMQIPRLERQNVTVRIVNPATTMPRCYK